VRVDDVAAPQTLAEAISILKRRPEVIPWAGGTLLMTIGDEAGGGKPVSVLDLGRIPELSVVSRSDRYLEIGACVSLSTILALPPSLSLQPLRSAAGFIGTATVRNLATIGGNIASRNSFMSCFSALVCMDAAVELRDASGSRWSGMHALMNEDNRPRFPSASLLTRIRIPTAPWDATVLYRLGEATSQEPYAASFAAAARFEKEMISELRIVAAGRRIVRDRALELSLVGKRLPISQKDAEAARAVAKARAMEAGFGDGTAGLYGEYLAAFLSGVQEEGL
jgi:CO/xanthine dehydrogenase FAD-binding subunit